ncbi:MAG: hypothetical protein AAF597_12620, partial [Bacteroidota bacterium]
SLYSVSTEDATTVNVIDNTVVPPITETVPTADRAGTITVNLLNNTSLTGANLIDIDGDGNFDDFAGGTDLRFRFTLNPSCAAADEEFNCTAVPNFPGGTDPGPDCRIREIFVTGRTGCGSRTRSTTLPLNGGTEFGAFSNSTFTNSADFTFNGVTFNGYDFGVTGDGTNNSIDDPTVSTLPLNFEYTLDAADIVQCDDNSTATVEMILVINGADTITKNFDFSDFVFNGGTPMTPIVEYNPGQTVVTVPVGDITPGMTFGYSINASIDVSTCGPPELLTVSAFLRSDCNPDCDCVATRTCSNTFFRVAPQFFDCTVPCIWDNYVFIDRVSTGYTDDTRTTDVDPESLTDDDMARFIPGDTLKFTGAYVMRDETYTIEDMNRFIVFESRLWAGTGNQRTASRDMRALPDYSVRQVTRFGLFRGGNYIDIGSAYSGPQGAGNRAEVGLSIDAGRRTSGENFAGNGIMTFAPGTVVQPGFPNGGYFFAAGGELNAEDGARYRITIMKDFEGFADGITTFFNAIDGAIMPGDSIILEWQVPMIQNPVSQTLNQNRILGSRDFGLQPISAASFFDPITG